MAKLRKLEHPPIREALIDIYVTGVNDSRVKNLEALKNELRDRYPEVQVRNSLEATLEVNRGGDIAAAAKKLGLLGYFFKVSTGERIAQFRRNGFTLNQLPPYSTAEAMIEEVRDLWPRYRRVAEPEAVTRIALRYINDLRLPFRAGESFKRFLSAAPELPEEVPQTMSSFQVQTVLTDLPTQSDVKISQSLAAASPAARYVLDIEVSQSGPWDPGLPLDERLQTLRVLKNRIFFSMVTEEALDECERANANTTTIS